MRERQLPGQRVLVTGVGLAVAEGLVREGAQVALLARNELGLAAAKRKLAEHGGDAVTVAADVTDREALAAAVEEEVERMAPGFRRLIVKRHLQTPLDLERHNRNLVGGAINGGTAQLYQQAIFRPFPGLGRPTTPVRGLYLASSSAHPGGGLHGGPGGNAAQTALRYDPLRLRR